MWGEIFFPCIINNQSQREKKMNTKMIAKIGKVFSDYSDFFRGNSSYHLGGVMVDLVKVIRECQENLSEAEAIDEAVEIVNQYWLLDWSRCEEMYHRCKHHQAVHHAIEMGSSCSPNGTW
jgi:hypothetical protein